MNKEIVKKIIEVASGRLDADLVIKNAKVVDVYSGVIREGDVAICEKYIAGIGEYSSSNEFDANGKYLTPGFIDSHIHIESAYVSPEELGKMLVPCGGTTIIADPHEIVNVCGIDGLDYMMEAAKNTKLDIKFMLPSCVPATPHEHSGATIDAKKMQEPITRSQVLGLGEYMNFPGIIYNVDSEIDKVMVAKEHGKLIDGHAPVITDKDLNAYTSVGIRTDHECSSVEEMHDRIARGVYVLLRQGSACHDLRNLLKGVTPQNSRRCLLCSDDRQPKTIIELGHLDNHLKICVEEGLDPITAIQMATINAAECFELTDRGAIAPGLKADIVLLEDLKDFVVSDVFIDGSHVANGKDYLPTFEKHDITKVKGSVKVKDFSKEKLKFNLKSNNVHVIELIEGSVVTKKAIETVTVNDSGDFVYEETKNIVKMAVVERHQNTGNVALGLIKGYGIKKGAIALSIAHDSHNLIVVGVNDDDMELAINTLIAQEGGVVLVADGEVLDAMPMPLGGIMSDQSGEWVKDKLITLHDKAQTELKINPNIEPVMTLCFMSLAVIPEIKLTDMGLFDVTKFDFIPIEADEI